MDMDVTYSPTFSPGKYDKMIDLGTGNPFIEKSDIINHQGKIMKISNRMGNIQNLYQSQLTKA
jgi:hypothetical protein